MHADSAEQSICRCCSIQWCRLDHLQCEVVHLQWLAAVLCADVCTSAQCTAALSDTTPATTTRTGYKLAKFTTCQHSTAQPVCVGVSRNIGKIMWFLLCEDVNVSVYLSVKTHKSSKSFHHEMSVIKHLFNHWKVELRGSALDLVHFLTLCEDQDSLFCFDYCERLSDKTVSKLTPAAQHQLSQQIYIKHQPSLVSDCSSGYFRWIIVIGHCHCLVRLCHGRSQFANVWPQSCNRWKELIFSLL